MSDWFEKPEPEEVVVEEPKKSKVTLFDFLKDLTYHKEYILDEDNKKEYNQYMINRFFSMDAGTVLHSQEMNLRPDIKKEMHFSYFFNCLRKKKSFFPYVKGDQKNTETLKLLGEYYGYNLNRCKEVLSLHSLQDIEEIRNRLYVGGVDGKKKRK